LGKSYKPADAVIKMKAIAMAMAGGFFDDRAARFAANISSNIKGGAANSGHFYGRLALRKSTRRGAPREILSRLVTPNGTRSCSSSKACLKATYRQIDLAGDQPIRTLAQMGHGIGLVPAAFWAKMLRNPLIALRRLRGSGARATPMAGKSAAGKLSATADAGSNRSCGRPTLDILANA
jgi:hypothetical protein